MEKYLDTFYDWWKNIDKFLLFLILGLFLLGLFFSLVSTSLIASDKLNTKSYYFFFNISNFDFDNVLLFKSKNLNKIFINFIHFCIFKPVISSFSWD